MKLKPNQIVVEIDDDGNLTTVDVERAEPIDRYALLVLQMATTYGCGKLPPEVKALIDHLLKQRQAQKSTQQKPSDEAQTVLSFEQIYDLSLTMGHKPETVNALELQRTIDHLVKRQEYEKAHKLWKIKNQSA